MIKFKQINDLIQFAKLFIDSLPFIQPPAGTPQLPIQVIIIHRKFISFINIQIKYLQI